MADNQNGSSEDLTSKQKKSSVSSQLRLELSVCQDGSLVTAPLSTILNAASESLYRDLYKMTNEELTMVVPSDHSSSNNNPANSSTSTTSTRLTTRKGKMSSLSFLERRVKLGSNLARHSESISHITALVASYLPQSASSSSSTTTHRSSRRNCNNEKHQQANAVPKEFELTEITQLVSSALAHVHKTWVTADEAQDALFVYHGTLWQSRSHPHDVLGAMGVLVGGPCWTDLPKDINLALDAYSVSTERGYSRRDTIERLQSVIRRKMVLGEIGMLRKFQKDRKDPFQWNMLLEQNGTVLRLTYGAQHSSSSTSSIKTQVIYPIEARVTILSEQTTPLPPWKLLSIRVQVSPKTGESNHQLELSSEQMFNFHKLCVVAMNQEEANLLKTEKKTEIRMSGTSGFKRNLVATPLARLLEMSHIFSISLQMDILSCQADALRKGSWSSGGSSGIQSNIEVTPVRFLEWERDNGNGMMGGHDHIKSEEDRVQEQYPLAIMAIHFWSVDDRYGSPEMGSLMPMEEVAKYPLRISNNNTIKKNIANRSKSEKSGRLTLEIRAIPRVGLEVSLSGGHSVMDILQKDPHKQSANTKHLYRSVKKLLSSIQDPFQLSASDALLSATVICAERRCHAVIAALYRARDIGMIEQNLSILPPWLNLSVECGSISIAVSLSYDEKDRCDENHQPTQRYAQRPPAILFRLACDSRTGSFVASFPRAASLIRSLACNDSTASEVQFLRQNNAELHSSTNSARQGVNAAGTGKDLTGRIVRAAFENLTRSIDTLGRRVGVGKDWEDRGKDNNALREKAIMQSCRDVQTSLMTCAGMSAVYGVAALAAGVASGVNAIVDIAGGPVELGDGTSLQAIPPLAIIARQQMLEYTRINGNGENEIAMRVERELCGISCSISHERLLLQFLDITTRLESPTGLTERMHCSLVRTEPENDSESIPNQAHKRIRLDDRKSIEPDLSQSCEVRPMFEEVQHLALRLNTTWNTTYDRD